MKKEPTFIYADGQTICILDSGISGIAECHPDDKDMMNARTGQEIAYRRAEINAYKKFKDDIKIRLSALNQLYYSMNMSKHFNSNSYENKMLQRQIRLLNDDLATTNEMIATLQENLKVYLKEKDDFYKKIRANRERKAQHD
jgi:chromosome segregation ATPase